MHFIKLTAIVFRVFVSQYLGRPVNEVKPEDFLWYSQQLRSTCTQRGDLTDTVLCIFQIFFREDPKSAHAKDLVGGWLRRGSSLVNILYDAEYKCANKKTELRQEDFHAYNIKYRDWRIRSTAEVFNRSADTIDAILAVMVQYNHPTFPVSNVINKQRNPPSTLLMLSPPRHRHRGLTNLVRRQDCDDCTNESDQMQSANDNQCQTDICTSTNQSDNENDCYVATCSPAVSDEVVDQCHSYNNMLILTIKMVIFMTTIEISNIMFIIWMQLYDFYLKIC